MGEEKESVDWQRKHNPEHKELPSRRLKKYVCNQLKSAKESYDDWSRERREIKSREKAIYEKAYREARLNEIRVKARRDAKNRANRSWSEWLLGETPKKQSVKGKSRVSHVEIVVRGADSGKRKGIVKKKQKKEQSVDPVSQFLDIL